MDKEIVPFPLFVLVLADNCKEKREAFQIRTDKRKMIMMKISAMIITYIAYLRSTYNEIDIIMGRPNFASVVACKETAI